MRVNKGYEVTVRADAAQLEQLLNNLLHKRWTHRSRPTARLSAGGRFLVRRDLCADEGQGSDPQLVRALLYDQPGGSGIGLTSVGNRGGPRWSLALANSKDGWLRSAAAAAEMIVSPFAVRSAEQRGDESARAALPRRVAVTDKAAARGVPCAGQWNPTSGVSA